MKIKTLALLFATFLVAIESQAVLTITNGDFETDVAPMLVDVPGWFDYDNEGEGDLAWWQQASQDNTQGISPFPNDSSYLFLSGAAAQPFWAYQGVGTNSTGLSSIFVNFDVGTLSDAGAVPLDRSVTFELYESDGSFVGAENADISGGTGVTLIDSVEITTGPLGAGIWQSRNAELDISGASTGADLFLRVSNGQVEGGPHYVGIDNISLSETPLDVINLELEVNRDTGAMRFINNGSTVNLVQYTVTSAAGTLAEGNWQSITDNGDQDSGGTIDPDDAWEIVTSTSVELQEQDPLTSGSNDGAQFSSEIPIGTDVWQKYYNEDVAANVLVCIVCDGSDDDQRGIPVNYVGGNQQAFLRSDFDFDNDIDVDDFQTLLSNHLAEITETTASASYALGDIDGNLVNDAADFRLFKADFIAANGEAAFGALLAGNKVPEPSGLALVCGGLAIAVGATRRRLPKLKPMAAALLAAAFLAATADQSHAALSITNGDFENGAGAFLTDVPDWFDYDGGGALPWWQQASVDNTPAVSPFAGDSSYLFLSGADVATPYWAYQGIGTNSESKSSVFINFDLGTLDDAGPAPLNRTVTFDIYQSDGTYAGGAEDVDIVGAPGISLIDSYSVQSGPLLAGNTISLSGELDLSTASSTNDLFLRVSNASVDEAAHYVGLDNFSLTDTPLNALEVPTFRLEVNTSTGELGFRNKTGGIVSVDQYQIQSDNGGLNSLGWDSFGAQGLDIVDGPDADTTPGSSLGETWSIAGGVDEEETSTNLLAELFLLGETTFLDGEFKSIGTGYNTSVGDTDLAFSYSTPNGTLLGTVVYDPVVAATLPGDFNGDQVVNMLDYNVWRDNVGASESVLEPGSSDDGTNTVDIGDYTTWQSNFGATAAGSAITSDSAVPEPSTLLLGLCVVSLLGIAPRLRA